MRPSRLLALRTLELVLTCVAALVVVAAPLALMVALLPRLIEPDPDLPPAMLAHVSVPPLLISAAVAVALAVLRDERFAGRDHSKRAVD